MNMPTHKITPHLFFQFMVDSQSGQSGDFAVCPVASEHRRGSDSVTILCLLMVDAVARVQTWRHATARESPAPVRILQLHVSRRARARG